MISDIVKKPTCLHLTRISQPGRNSINRQKHSISKASAFTLLLAGCLLLGLIKYKRATERTQATQQFHLKVAQRINIGITAANRVLKDRGVIKQISAPHNLQQHTPCTLILNPDLLRKTLGPFLTFSHRCTSLRDINLALAPAHQPICRKYLHASST